MSKSELIKSSGWAFILAGFSFATILTASDPIAIPGSVISSILLAAGMSGLRARYGERAGSLGRSMLLVGMLGPVLWAIIIASGVFMYGSGKLTDTEVSDGLWVGVFGAPVISLLGLTLFGLIALYRKPMPRLNWLPAFAGIWYPVFYFFAAGYLFTHQGKYQYDAAIRMIVIIALIEFVALCALGAFLNSDPPQEMATA